MRFHLSSSTQEDYHLRSTKLQKLFYRLRLNTLDIIFVVAAKAKNLKNLTNVTLDGIDIADYKLTWINITNRVTCGKKRHQG